MNQVCIIREGSLGLVATDETLISLWTFAAEIQSETRKSRHPAPKMPGIPIKLLN